MQEEIAALVYPILSYGLQLKERLDNGENMDLAEQQSIIKGMLLTETEARRWVDFGGEGLSAGLSLHNFNLSAPPAELPRGSGRFLGVRYALACWLDELFILDSPWSSDWNESKLEASLYGTNDRAWKFWEQAQQAEKRPTRDALEAFFLCVMLGFRGEYLEDLTKLDNWIAAARAHISRGMAADWPYPPELEPPTNVTPRRGRDRLRTMVLRGGMVLLLLIPFLVAFLIQQLGH